MCFPHEDEDAAILLALVSTTRDDLKKEVTKAIDNVDKEERSAVDLLPRYDSRKDANQIDHDDIVIPLRLRLNAVQTVKKGTDEFAKYKKSALEVWKKQQEDSDTPKELARRQLPCQVKTFDMLQCLEDLNRAVAVIGVGVTCAVALTKDCARFKNERIGAVKFIVTSMGRLSKHLSELLAKDDRELVSRAAVKSHGGVRASEIAKAGKISLRDSSSRIFQLDLQINGRHKPMVQGTDTTKFILEQFDEPWYVSHASLAKKMFQDGALAPQPPCIQGVLCQGQAAEKRHEELDSCFKFTQSSSEGVPGNSCS